MAQEILDTADIVPGRRGWTCVLQVIERHPVLHKSLPPHPFVKKYREYFLTEMKGTKVRAVMFDHDIDFFERSLLPFKRFSNLCQFAGPGTNVAIRGLIVHCFTIIDINDAESVKAYVIVNEEEIPIVLRLSKDLLVDHDPNVNTFHKEPLTIIASNLEVKTFHGLSLAARSNTYFGNFRTTYLIENPPLPEDLGLKKWYADNKEKVLEWVKNKAYEDTNRFFPPSTPERVLDLTTAMLAFQNVETCWVKAKVQLSITRAPLCYVVCRNCGMQVEASADWNIESSADVECLGCSVLSPIQVRLKLPVTLIDDNINLRTTLKSPDAEKICPFAAVEIKKHEDEGV